MFGYLVNLNCSLFLIMDSDDINISVDKLKFQKMMFIFNAINDGWTIKKREESYIFSKNHENKKEVFTDSYLGSFLKSNLDMNKLGRD